MEKKIVIGLVGIIASGKDTTADYIVKKYNGQNVSFSQPLRDILKRVFLPINRVNMSKLAQILIDNFGGDVLSRTIAEEIKINPKNIFILPNIRRESDYSCLVNEDNFVFLLIAVNTDEKVCHSRLIQRNQNVDDKTKTWEDFQKDLQLSTELGIKGLIKKSAYQIDNNGSIENLFMQVDSILKNVLN